MSDIRDQIHKDYEETKSKYIDLIMEIESLWKECIGAQAKCDRLHSHLALLNAHRHNLEKEYTYLPCLHRPEIADIWDEALTTPISWTNWYEIFPGAAEKCIIIKTSQNWFRRLTGRWVKILCAGGEVLWTRPGNLI